MQVGEIRPYFFTDEAVDALVVGVEGVGAEFEMGKQENHEANGEAEGKAAFACDQERVTTG